MNNTLAHKNLMLLITIAAGFGLLYYQTILSLINNWSGNPNFTHGFLIPFVAAYMAWYKKNEWSQLEPTPSYIGVLIIFFGMLLHIVGYVGAELFTMRFSMVVTISGIVIYLLGFRFFSIFMVPILYLILMIPIPAILWNKIAFPLQLFSAEISSNAIQMLGIPIYREGNILHLANTSLEVVDACSGIRSLTSLLALTAAFAYLTSLSTVKKWILFLSAVPIAVAVNVIRLTITGMMAAWIGPETAHGFLHDMSGLIIFAAALVLVYSLYLIETKI